MFPLPQLSGLTLSLSWVEGVVPVLVLRLLYTRLARSILADTAVLAGSSPLLRRISVAWLSAMWGRLLALLTTLPVVSR